MTNKTTRRAMLSSVVALFLCCAMLMGTTYAWFTDSVTSANNVIKSGNLDVELEYWNGSAWVDVSGKSDILTNTLWEPGVTEVAYLRIANAGSLALKYMLGVNIMNEIAGTNAEGDPFLLSDYIQFGVVEGIEVNATTKAPTKYATREDAVAAVSAADKISTGYTKTSTMTAGQELYLALVVYMPETVGNEANHNGVNVPQIDLGINVIATQLAAENDSFGNDYDTESQYPTVNIITVPENGAEIALSIGNTKVTVPGTATAAGDVFELVVSNQNTVTDATTGETEVAFDLTLYKNNERVSGDTVYAIEILVGNVYVTAVKHNGNALTEATSGADQTYKVENGVMTVYTKSFSPFSYSYLVGDLIADKEGEQAYAMTFDEFRASVNAGNDFSGWTVMLQKDIDFAGAEWTPIGIATGAGTSVEGCAPFSGMFDGNGHTLSNYKVTEGVTVDGDPWLSLFALIYAKDGNTAGVKNLKIANAMYNNSNGTVGMIANLANSDGASKLEFSNLDISGTVSAFGYYGQAGIATLMYGNENVVENVKVDVDFIIPADFTVAGYKFISPCFGQLSMLENGHITLTNVDWSGCSYFYPDTFKLEDRGTVVAGYNSIWVYNTLAGIRVLGCGGYAGQFYDRGATFTIDGVTYTHAELLKEQKDYPGYMYDYIIRPDAFTAYTVVTTAEQFDAAIKAGGNVMLGADIAMESTITPAKSFVLDGNGYTITMAEACNNAYALFDSIPGGVIAEFKNVTFDGIRDGAIVRSIGATVTFNNVTVQNGTHTQQQGLLRLLGKSTITNCTFKNNTCSMVITLNYDGANDDPQVVDNCVFEGNTCNSTAVVYYVKGESATINGNKFIDNTVNCNTNGAVVYMGFTENNVVTNNLFQNNTTTDASTSTRVSGGIFFGYETVFEGNAFIDNEATNANGDALGNNVCVSTYYTDIDLSGNYWGGSAPVEGEDYFVQHKTSGYEVILNDYLTTYGE